MPPSVCMYVPANVCVSVARFLYILHSISIHLRGSFGKAEPRGRAAEGGVHDHRVANRSGGQTISRGPLLLSQLAERRGTTSRNIQPHRLTTRRQRRVRQAEPERLGDDLRSGRGTQELTTAARGGPGPPPCLGRLPDLCRLPSDQF